MLCCGEGVINVFERICGRDESDEREHNGREGHGVDLRLRQLGADRLDAVVPAEYVGSAVNSP